MAAAHPVPERLAGSPPSPARLVAVALAVISSVFFPLGIPWLSGALLGFTLIYLWSRPSPRDLLVMTGLAWALLAVRSVLSPGSLHLTWAVIPWWFAPPSPRWLRPLLAGFVATTGLATIGLGQHYLIDLIAAVPFMIGVIALFERRWTLAGVATLVTAMLLIALRATVRSA